MGLSSHLRLVVGSRTFRAADILTGVTITWGRASLYDTPAKRVLTAEVRTPLAGLFSTARAMTGQTATAYLDDEILFTGSLSDIATRRIDEATAALKFSSHETLGMNRALEKIINSNASEPFYLNPTIALQAPELHVTIEDQSPPHRTIKNTGTFRDVMVKNLCEALACPSEISRPAWSPDYRTVRSTIYRPPGRDKTTVEVPAGAVAIAPPTFSLRNFPTTLRLKLGTIWGDKEEQIRVIRPGLPGEITLDVPVNWDSFSTYRAGSDALRAAQISDPLVMKFSDSRTPDPRLFSTWETPSQVIKTSSFQRERSPLLTGADTLETVLIGGQLTFTSTEVTHRARAVYVTFAANTHKKYAELVDSYAQQTGRYEDL